MAAPKDVRDEEDYDNELQSAGNKLVVVDFHASWCGPCVRMHPVVNELTLKYPTVVFLKVDVDECGEVAAKENVTSMPTFLLYKNKIQVDVIKGANAAALEAAIKKHMSVGGEGEGSSVPGQLLLNTMLMKSDCECLNEADDHPMLSCIDPEKYSEEGSYLESDCDAELIMNLSFSVNVKIHSLVIEGPVSNGPKTIKIFTNQTKTMDFDNAKTTEPVQQIIVTPENLNGEPIPLRFVKFQNVGNFQVFIQDNQEGLDTTVIKKFQLYGHPISTTNMSDFKRIAGKKGEAH